jgi:hypothetical protein
MLSWVLLGLLVLATVVVVVLLWRLWGLRRRQDAILRFMDSADALERELHACRERMQSMQRWISTLPSDMTRTALASLDLDPLVQKALRDLLRQRLWLRDQGGAAPMTQLLQARADLERSRAALAENMEKLERVGAELAEAAGETHPVAAMMAGAYGIGSRDSDSRGTLH